MRPRNAAFDHFDTNELARYTVCFCSSSTSRPMKSPLSSLTKKPSPASSGVISEESSCPYSGKRASKRSVSRAPKPVGINRASACLRAADSHSCNASSSLAHKAQSRLRPCSLCAKQSLDFADNFYIRQEAKALDAAEIGAVSQPWLRSVRHADLAAPARQFHRIYFQVYTSRQLLLQPFHILINIRSIDDQHVVVSASL